MNTLVACPFHTRRMEAFDGWVRATSAYPRVVAMQSDDDIASVESLGVPVVVFEPVSERRGRGANQIYGPRFNEAWRAILDIAGDYSHILSLESDVHPPEGVDIRAIMEEHYSDCDFLMHGVPSRYPHRNHAPFYEMGCTFSTRELFEQALHLVETEPQAIGENLYGAVRNQNYFTRKEINLVELDHVGEGDPRFTQ